MGTLTLPPSGSVYVDANTIIYRVERVQPYLAITKPLWDALDAGAQAIIPKCMMLQAVHCPEMNQALPLLAVHRQHNAQTGIRSPATKRPVGAAARMCPITAAASVVPASISSPGHSGGRHAIPVRRSCISFRV